MPPSPDGPRLVIFTDAADWHLRRLQRALARRGLSAVVASLSDCAITVGEGDPIRIPGLLGRPDAVMVRGIAAGSFEAVTLRLGILHDLEAAGVTVWNPPRGIERCVDKSATSAALQRSGLPTPTSLVTENEATARAFAAAELERGGAVVVKPLFGSQGKGLGLMRALADLPPSDVVHGVWYLQRYVPASDGRFRDFRVFVSGGRVVGGMVRAAEGWITNVHQGARPEPFVVTPVAERLALAAARAVGAAFAGVDLIEDSPRGLSILEVNSMPAWHGLQTVTESDIAEALVADWLAAAGLAGEARAGAVA